MARKDYAALTRAIRKEHEDFDAAERTVRLMLEKYADRDGGGFFDRASDASPLGGRMSPALYSIWDSGLAGTHPWRAQLHGYVAHFVTRDRAERFIAAVQHERKRKAGIQPAKAKGKP